MQGTALSTAAGGVGGVPSFVLDENAKTLRLSDTRGDYTRDGGSAYLLNPDDWHGDAIRNITGYIGTMNCYPFSPRGGAFTSLGNGGYHNGANSTGQASYSNANFNASGSVPTAAENRTRAFATLGCVYTGELA